MAASKKQTVPDANIVIDGTGIEQVASVVYLGHMLTDGDGKSYNYLRTRQREVFF